MFRCNAHSCSLTAAVNVKENANVMLLCYMES